jgi:hypothetical protein
MALSFSVSPLQRKMLVSMLVSASAAANTVHAEPAATTGKPDPLDAKAKVPTLRYESSLKPGAAAAASEKPVSWREANDSVARIGGWRVYAREAQQPQPPSPPQPAKKESP